MWKPIYLDQSLDVVEMYQTVALTRAIQSSEDREVTARA